MHVLPTSGLKKPAVIRFVIEPFKRVVISQTLLDKMVRI
jgi:hypothetical protein